MAEFLKPISGQTLGSVFCRRSGLRLWEFAQIRGNGHQLWWWFFGSSRLFFVRVPCCAPSVSVLVLRVSLYGEQILLKHRGVGEAVSALISHLWSLVEGTAGGTCCLKGYC